MAGEQLDDSTGKERRGFGKGFGQGGIARKTQQREVGLRGNLKREAMGRAEGGTYKEIRAAEKDKAAFWSLE